MLRKLPFIVLFVAPVLAGGCFISGDSDNGKGNDCDCDHAHTTCVAGCNDDNDCIASCDTTRDDCDKHGC
jgi:hypothetical protein